MENSRKKANKILKIVFTIFSLAIFLVLSILNFYIFNSIDNKSNNLEGSIILIYGLSCLFILIWLLGIIFPKNINKLIYRFGVKVLFSSEYHSNAIVEEKETKKAFRILIISSLFIGISLVLACIIVNLYSR